LTGANQTFEAHAFHPGLGNEVTTGIIFMDRWTFHFQSEAAKAEIPMARLEVSFGEGEDERIYFTDPTQPDWKIFTTDQSILENRCLADNSSALDQLGRVAGRRELSRRLVVTAWVLGACVAVAWLGSVASSVMVRSLVARIPPEMEQKFGDALVEDLQVELALVDDTNRIAQLAALAAPLTQAVSHGQTGFKFHLVDDDDPNAFALPGGHVFVNTGLLKLADRPEEVLGAIAHEVAHVTEKHGFRKVISAAGPILLFRIFLGGGGGVGGVLADGSDLLVRQGFSQEYETEADDAGWKLLVAANVDPRGLTGILRKFESYEAGAKHVPAMPRAFSSHPALGKRIARLEAKWKKLPRKTGFVELKTNPPLAP
jgi:predicted Zn-dependent protease